MCGKWTRITHTRLKSGLLREQFHHNDHPVTTTYYRAAQKTGPLATVSQTVSQGSAVTRLRCGGICNDFVINFSAMSASERSLKIGRNTAMLGTRVQCHVFHSVTNSPF